MELVTHGYKKLARIECAICRENHIIEMSMNTDDNSLNFEMLEQPFSWRQILKHRIMMRFQRNSFLEGKQRKFFSLILGNDQVEQIINILEKAGYSAENKNAPFVKSVYDYIEYFSENGVMICKEIDFDQIEIAIYPSDYSFYSSNWSKGSGYASIDKEIANTLLKVLKNRLIELENL